MVITKAYNCYIEDKKGNKIIDTSMGAGSQIIGHDNKLMRKISEQVKRGTIYTIPNIHTDAVNFYLKKYQPCEGQGLPPHFLRSKKSVPSLGPLQIMQF